MRKRKASKREIEAWLKSIMDMAIERSQGRLGPSVRGLIDMEICYRLAAGIPFINQEAKKMSKRVYVARDKKYASGVLVSRSECGKVVIVLGNGKQLDLTAKEALSVYQFLKADNAD
jgi:hypothetical protein